MNSRRVIIVGGGAAGFFAAITCAETAPGTEVIVLERGPEFLSKVRISGGGRCNVTHSCFEPRELTTRFPRGERALIAPFQRFQARDTVAWFEARGVKLKTENDGRMFPVTDSSETVINCLLGEARRAGVKLQLNAGVERIARVTNGFEVTLASKAQRAGSEAGAPMRCDRLLLATGGCRAASAGQLAVSLGHTLAPPVPSLFTFHIEADWLRELAGVSVPVAEVSVADAKLRERGALLATHWGLSGPAILRLSAWGARALHEMDYKFPVQVNWLPNLTAESLASAVQSQRAAHPAKFIVNTPPIVREPLTPALSPSDGARGRSSGPIGNLPAPKTARALLPARLWEQLVLASGIARDVRWSALSRGAQHLLIQQLQRTEFQVVGKSLNKDEFVTCGGVKLDEVNFKTMESRVCPGLYFAGELLDIDGITGGFNFQAAWTTGWIAGNAMAI